MKRKSFARVRRSPFLFLSCAFLLAICFLAAPLRSAKVAAQQEETGDSPAVYVFNEDFDSVTAPALPAGWTTSITGTITPFTTISNMPDSPPNCIFVEDPNTSGTSQLVSPSIALGANRHRLNFRHFYSTDYEFDGGVLEMSVNGGAFTDIVTAGGVFLSGGYDTILVGGTLSGRNSWSGMQPGFITTKISLPASTSNQSVRFRWRIGTDDMESGAGWRIDNVQVVDEPTIPAATGFSENFDGVTAPALPANWTTATTGGVAAFRTGVGTNAAQTPPNTAFVVDSDSAGTTDLVSPSVALGSVASRLVFRHAYANQAGLDGAVLEIKIGAAAFQDIIQAGGAFVEGGYSNVTNINSATNPLNGRTAWTGSSSNNIPPRFINTIINLPSNAANQIVQFRWRYATDATPGLSYGGWWIDSIRLENRAAANGFTETFDAVSQPTLPAGWTTSTTGAGATPFATVALTPDTAPNAVFTNAPATVSTAELVSPVIRIGGNQPKIIFRHSYNLETAYDGAVLEIKINNGNFQDVVAAGGSFAAGGYTTALNTGFANPLPDRPAWTGNSNGYITTDINLPSAAYGQDVQFRWLRGTDSAFAALNGGWRIDSVQVTNAVSGENVNQISIPTSGAANPYPSEINITGYQGLVSGVTVNLENFSHDAPDDVDLILVAPNNRRVVLMSDVGGANPVNSISLSFDDSANDFMPDTTPLAAGNYKPTDYETGDQFPAPAGAPTGKMLSSFNGSDPNGAWRLFLVDDSGGNAGNISGGWNLLVQTSPNLINIPAVGAANPYPSQVVVSGLQGSITKAVVTLSNFSHLVPDDVDIMLVAPNNRRVVLMSDVGGATEVGGLNLTFDDAATLNLPDNQPLVSGNYKPTDFETGDQFPAPAPPGAPNGTTLNSAFYGSAPNGVWRIYAVDDNGENYGSIAENFSLSLTTSTAACAFTLSPGGQGFSITGGTGSFAVNMPPGCPWTASTNSNFVTLTSSTDGEGAGTVSFNVAQNMTGGRTASIIVTNGVLSQSFLVQQQSGCPFSLSNTVQNVSAAGAATSVSVTAGATCVYQATSSVSWIQISSGSQTGNGAISFTVSPNTTGVLRTGTVTIGARTLTVNQAGASAKPFDFDADGKSDIAVFRPSSGIWYSRNSTNNATAAAQFGLATDRLVPADYDGDRKTDYAVFRDGIWYILQSQTNTVRSYNWGISADVPVPADYDGDGKTDVAVFRPADTNWYVIRSGSGTSQAVTFGAATDQPVPADYDGDGRADFAVYRAGANSTWFVLQSGSGTVAAKPFGINGDIAVAADFDADGRDNIAVFRPSNGTWYWAASDGSGFEARQFGLSGDVPAAADYNGDNRADIAVFRSGVWYILLLGSETVRAEQFGLADDKPVSAAYNRQ